MDVASKKAGTAVVTTGAAKTASALPHSARLPARAARYVAGRGRCFRSPVRSAIMGSSVGTVGQLGYPPWGLDGNTAGPSGRAGPRYSSGLRTGRCRTGVGRGAAGGRGGVQRGELFFQLLVVFEEGREERAGRLARLPESLNGGFLVFVLAPL